MTTDNITQEDLALLTACRKYIQVTDTNPKHFVEELMQLAMQYLEHFPCDQDLFPSED